MEFSRIVKSNDMFPNVSHVPCLAHVMLFLDDVLTFLCILSGHIVFLHLYNFFDISIIIQYNHDKQGFKVVAHMRHELLALQWVFKIQVENEQV